MINIAPYVPKYVRLLNATEEPIEVPYSQTQFGVVLMVDVAGFSTLMTIATEKGESGAEAIALEVGAYMGECIQIIEFYGGDVVKFLGDAVLVCFQPNVAKPRQDCDPNNSNGNGRETRDRPEVSARKKNMLVRRAVECGLQLLARLSHYRVYLTAEERTKHRKASGEIERRSPDSRTHRNDSHVNIFDLKNSILQNEADQSVNPAIQSGSMSFSRYGIMKLFERLKYHMARGKRRRSSLTNISTRNLTAIDLELHIALSCGDVTNIIIGNTEVDESDINWAAPMYRMSPALVSTHSNTPVGSSSSAGDSSTSSVDVNCASKEYYSQYHGRLEYAIGGPPVEDLDEALGVAKAGEMSVTPAAYEFVKNQATQDDLAYDLREGYYVVCNTDSNRRTSLLPSHAAGAGIASSSASASTSAAAAAAAGAAFATVTHQTPNAEYLQDMPELMRRASRMNIEPLVPRIRNTSYMQLSMDTHTYLCKYINRSAVYRLRTYADGNFPAQFREATIMFVSLGKVNVSTAEGLETAQKALSIAIKVLVRYEGLLQQFAIDDKGATILGIFGLPPMSHESEGPFAARAAMALRDRYRSMATQLPDFSIALSTGRIFSAVVPQGNPFRRDPGIAGDAIILAVRMLKFPFCKQAVVCDAPTKQQIGGLCDFNDLGVNFVKGKVKPIQMYGISQLRHVSVQKRLSFHPVGMDFVGYQSQMEEATGFADSWCSAPNHHLLVIVGSTGSGKSFFCQNFQCAISSSDVTSCWSSCSEVERCTKYFAFKSLLLSVLELIDSLPLPNVQEPRQSSYGRTLDDVTGSSITPTSSVGSISHPPSSEWIKRLTWGGNSSSKAAAAAQRSSWYTPELSKSEEAILLRRCLEKCGEDERLLPLFRAVFPSIYDEIDENKYTKLLDSRTRDLLLDGVILRMIQYASTVVNLVMICDDVQWADQTSLHMLQLIHEVCQRVLLVIATRPAVEYSTPFTNALRKTGSYLKISLRGLTRDSDIAQVVLQSFPKTVKHVSASIIKMVLKRTEGNPLYIKNMTVIMKEYQLVTVKGDQLVPTTDGKDVGAILGEANQGRMIKLQFDRLEGCFQEFLVVASCLDQYFDVYEVHAGVDEGNAIFRNPHDASMIQSEIRKRDQYKFLRQDDVNSVVENALEVYTFAHISIPKSIYDLTSFETRNTLHRRLARYYELQMNRENYVQLLGKVTRHYRETDMLDKQLYYLEALAEVDMRANLIAEATTNLENIATILKQNEQLSAQYGELHKSNIYRRLGICLTMRSDYPEAAQYLHMALESLGVPWPTSSIDFVVGFWKGQFTQFRHRHMHHFWRRQNNASKKELGRRITEIMMQLCNIYYFCGEGEKFIYACIMGLNMCERMGDHSSRYTFFLSRMALLSWLNNHRKQSVYYINRAFDYMGSKLDPGALNICAILCFAGGQFSKADQYLQQSFNLTRTLGVVVDYQEFYRAVRVLVTIRLLEGTLEHSPFALSVLQQMADTGHRNNDHEVSIHVAIYQVANAIINWRLRSSDPYVYWLQSKIPTTTEYNQLAIHGILMHYYTRDADFPRALEHTRGLLNLLPTLSMTVNVFPVLGLMFAVMALYKATEMGYLAYWDIIQDDYDKFATFCNQLVHALDRVKYWSVAQPFIYLARALPYIATGRTVEGYSVLHNGMLQTIPALAEVKFLRALYLSKLGRFAFTKEDRIAWTQEAEKIFREVKVPAQLYCNPQPDVPPELALQFEPQKNSTDDNEDESSSSTVDDSRHARDG